MTRSRTKLVAVAGIFLVGILPALTANAVAPDNDLIENATVIGALPFSESLDTTDAHADGPRGDCGNSGSVFYRFKPSADVRVQVDTLGSDYDTMLSLYQGPRSNPRFIKCRDDSFGVQTSMRLTAREGVRYWIVAGRCCGNGRDGGGELLLHVQELPLDDLTVDLLVTGGSIDAISGDVALEGTVECSHPAAVFVGFSLRQLHGDFVAHASDGDQIYCDGTGVLPWATGGTLPDNGIAFVAGDARARSSWTAFDGEHTEFSDEQNQVVTLVVV